MEQPWRGLNMGPRGFTLIELMLAVAIVGCLAAIAIPNFMRFQCKARQAEVRVRLKAIMTAEKAYHADHGQYFGDTMVKEILGFHPYTSSPYYVYMIQENPLILNAIDLNRKLNANSPQPLWSDYWWWVDADGQPVHMADACTY